MENPNAGALPAHMAILATLEEVFESEDFNTADTETVAAQFIALSAFFEHLRLTATEALEMQGDFEELRTRIRAGTNLTAIHESLDIIGDRIQSVIAYEGEGAAARSSSGNPTDGPFPPVR